MKRLLVLLAFLFIKTAEPGNVLDESNPNNLILTQMSVLVEGRDPVTIDVANPPAEPITLKEGASYRLKIDFYIQREILAGLTYHQVITRKGLKTDKDNIEMGSYGPTGELQSFTTTEVFEAPKGMVLRGNYKVQSMVVNNGRDERVDWTWGFAVKKDWD